MLPLVDIQNGWYQQDGAPSHNSRAVREYLRRTFPQKWIDTHSAISWPIRYY